MSSRLGVTVKNSRTTAGFIVGPEAPECQAASPEAMAFHTMLPHERHEAAIAAGKACADAAHNPVIQRGVAEARRLGAIK